MADLSEIDHEDTYEVVCPYCGHEHLDSSELDDSGKMECDKCEKAFNFEREITVDYSTWKIKE